MTKHEQHFRFTTENSLGKTTKVSELTETEAKSALCYAIDEISERNGKIEQLEELANDRLAQIRTIEGIFVGFKHEIQNALK